MSRDILIEKVPSLSTRGGDVVFSSSNNSSLILGRDRLGDVSSGYGDETGSGAITLVVGRSSEDPSTAEDAATVYVSSRTDPDEQIGTSVGSEKTSKSAVIAKADCVRVVARDDLKIIVGKASFILSSDGSIVVEGNVRLGASAFERAIKGDSFFQQYLFHTHPVATTPAGMVAGPMQPAPSPDLLLSSKLKMT